MIDVLHIENFLLFETLNINNFKRINLIAGKNNVGKTALLEAIRIYVSGFDNSVINNVLAKRGAFLVGRTDIYLSLFNRSCVREYEKGKEIKLKIGEYELRGANKKIGSRGEQAEFRYFSDFMLAKDELLGKYSLQAVSSDFPKDNGVFLSTSLQNSDYERLWDDIALTTKEDLVVKIIQDVIEPKLLRIDISSHGIKIRLEGVDNPIPIEALGEGVKRILLISLALVNAKGKYLLIDEIELGLHHSVMEKLWDVIFKYAEDLDVQVFTTTHSQDIIKSFYYAASHERNFWKAEFIRLQTSRTGKIEAIIYDGERLADSLNLALEIR